MSDQKERRFAEQIAANYQPPAGLGADLERRVLAQVEARSSPWRWLVPGGAMAVAVAAALLFWARPAEQPALVPGADPIEVATLVLALETDEVTAEDSLPDEYALLGDIWDEEIEL